MPKWSVSPDILLRSAFTIPGLQAGPFLCESPARHGHGCCEDGEREAAEADTWSVEVIPDCVILSGT